MAVRKIPETKMLLNQNPNGVSDGKLDQMKKEFKPIRCDVFPAKKRLVKTMMFNFMAQKISSVFCYGPAQKGKSCFGIVSPPKISGVNKREKIVPYPKF